ncbi:MAG: YjjG family noncanonical pyrimidine nucleotidase [Bacillota bacterium]
MKRYNLILLDADGTLFDFERAETIALQQVLAHHQLAYSDALRARYREINSSLWIEFERGLVDKARLQVARFENLLAEFKLDGDPAVLNTVYTDYLAEARHLIDGAVELCQELSENYTLAIASNGIARTQRRRIKGSAIEPYIKHIVVSEEAGYQKPHQGFFEYAMRICGETDKDKVMIVGDSLSADIKGGVDFGITTCWYNPAGAANTDGLRIDHTIRELRELTRLLACSAS